MEVKCTLVQPESARLLFSLPTIREQLAINPIRRGEESRENMICLLVLAISRNQFWLTRHFDGPSMSDKPATLFDGQRIRASVRSSQCHQQREHGDEPSWPVTQCALLRVHARSSLQGILHRR